MSVRYEDDEQGRKDSGFANSTYATIFDRLDREGSDVIVDPLLEYCKTLRFLGQTNIYQGHHPLSVAS